MGVVVLVVVVLVLYVGSLFMWRSCGGCIGMVGGFSCMVSLSYCWFGFDLCIGLGGGG